MSNALQFAHLPHPQFQPSPPVLSLIHVNRDPNTARMARQHRRLRRTVVWRLTAGMSRG
jgi:hypothetical protein